MKLKRLSMVALLGGVAAASAPMSRAAGAIQVGPSGKTYASASLQCGLHPVAGWSPMVQAGLYAPKKKSTATVSLDGAAVADVSYASPDATVWLANGVDDVAVALSRKVSDTYVFDASLAYAEQPNACIPDTRGNTIGADVEYAASLKSYATTAPGCAINPRTGLAQEFVNLVDNGSYLLNVSVNGVPLTQLDGRTRLHAAVFLAAGLNVIAAANGTLSTDDYVRDGGTGSCVIP